MYSQNNGSCAKGKIKSERSVVSQKSNIKSRSIFPKIRFWVGFAVLVGIFIATYFYVAFSPCVWLRLGPITFMCPVGFFEIILSAKTVPLSLLPGMAMVFLLIFAIGRAWCGWVCPASLAGSSAAGLFKWLLPTFLFQSVRKGYGKVSVFAQTRVQFSFADGLAVFAGLLLGIAVFSYPFWSIICPLGVVSRNIVAFGTNFHLRFDMLFLLLPLLVLPFFKGGWKCSCPVGLTHGLVSGNKALLKPVLKLDNNCNQCGLCKKLCPVEQNPALGVVDSALCTRCGICVEKCPKNSLAFKIK